MLVGQSMGDAFQRVQRVVSVVMNDGVTRSAASTLQGRVSHQVKLSEDRIDNCGVDDGSVRNIELVVLAINRELNQKVVTKP
jgi:hypothetical protein